MVRTPDGSTSRSVMIPARMTPEMVTGLDGQRAFRGGMSRSSYIRWLIQQDAKRIERERGQ